MCGCVDKLDTLAVVWTCKMRDCIVVCMNVFIYVERTILQNMYSRKARLLSVAQEAEDERPLKIKIQDLSSQEQR